MFAPVPKVQGPGQGLAVRDAQGEAESGVLRLRKQYGC